MTASPTIGTLTSLDIYDKDNGNTVFDYSAGSPLMWTDGAGNLTAQTLQGNQTTGAVQSLATGNTNTVGVFGVVRVTAAAAVTGIILPVGSRPGQQLIVIHEGAAANTITFAASGTSNVADGASAVITG